MASVDPYSVATLAIQMYFGATYLSHGTGFYWKHANNIYLISNWHNFSGKNPFTGKHISKNLSEPDKISVRVRKDGDINISQYINLDLYNQDGKPIWLSHPRLIQNHVDIAALPLNFDNTIYAPAINEIDESPIKLLIGSDLFILGFPFEIPYDGLPVWKRASVATEPAISEATSTYMLADTASRPGMSGSPVIVRSWGTHHMEDGSTTIAPGSCTRVAGIYSGHLESSDAMDAQLGMVWPRKLIDELFQ